MTLRCAAALKRCRLMRQWGETMKKQTVFDTIIDEVMADADGAALLEEGMSRDMNRVKKIPLRYRIIALGFVGRMSLDELNSKLKASGCAGLYARSLWEAGLIYAFSNRLSYREWKSLQEICLDFRGSHAVEDQYFKGSSISMSELSRYVRDGSAPSEDLTRTRHLTRVVERQIIDTAKGEDAFRAFLEENAAVFSPVREKTRYYFCRYLYAMLLGRIEQYVSALEQSVAVEDAFSQLVVFKGISALRRRKHTPQEARDFLMQADISCGEIFDAFNYFYFEYVSLDWMQVLIEYYGDIASLPPSARHTLAEYLRRYDPAVYSSGDDDKLLGILQERLEAEEAQLDEIYSLDGKNRGYQKNRAGENTLRKYIKGALDPDRTTLICFLLFFEKDAMLPEEDRMTPARLNHILLECGFVPLREEDDFDSFVLQYLDEADPDSFLMEEVTNSALDEENFYLYRMYQASTSYSEELEKLIK